MIYAACFALGALSSALFFVIYFAYNPRPRVDLQKNAKTIDFSHLVPSNTGRSFSVKKKHPIKHNDDFAAWRKEKEKN